MAKNIIKTKTNFLDGLKKFTNTIVANKLDEEILLGIIDKYKIDNTIIKKLLSYISGNSHLIIYFNKYLNKLGGNYNLVDFVKAYRYILSCNGFLDSRGFLYIKSSDCIDPMQKKIIDLLGEYFYITTGERFHYRELLFFYNLFLIGEISHDDIYHADILVNNGQQTIELSGFIPPKPKEDEIISIQNVISTLKSKTGGIEKINNDSYQLKLNNCKDCKFFQNPFLAVDGNLVNGDQPDVVLLNLNPTLDDFKSKRMYKEGSFLRKQIEEFPEGTRWLMVNLIPCAFKSKSVIGSIEDVQNQLEKCYSVVQNTIETFKANLYILIGEEVSNEYISEPFSDVLGKLVNDKFIVVHHPSNLRNPKAQIKGKEIWKFVQEHLKNTEIDPNNETDEPEVIINEIKEEKVEEKKVEEAAPPAEIEEIQEKPGKSRQEAKGNLLLLDVRELRNGKVLMVFTDEEGNKYYEQKEKKQTAYIKNKDFKECSILTKDVDLEFTMNGYQRSQLIKILRNKMTELKRRGI